MTHLRVERFDGIEELTRLAPVLDGINNRAKNASPFHSSSFLIAYASHSEFFPGGIAPCVYLAFEGSSHSQPVGAVVMRREEVRTGPAGCLRWTRVDFLATHDTDDSTISAICGMELPVTAAILEFLVAEKDWSLLEFRAQELDSLIRELAMHRNNGRLQVRDIEILPFERVSLVWPDMRAYFASLSKRMRSNVSRQTRHLFAGGDVEILTAQGGQAVGALFNAYCELENRSWKAGTDVALQRHVQRTAFYAELVSGRAGLDPVLVGITLDGVLVAALISAVGGGHMWSFEMSFDEAHGALGPGQLLLLLTVGKAISLGCSSLRFFQHHEYFKKRWLAEPTKSVNVQIIRRFSVMGARALVGDAKRAAHARRARLRALSKSDEPRAVDTNAVELNAVELNAVETSATADESAPTVGEARFNVTKRRVVNSKNQSRMKEVSSPQELLLKAIETAGTGLVRLQRIDAETLLPFAF